MMKNLYLLLAAAVLTTTSFTLKPIAKSFDALQINHVPFYSASKQRIVKTFGKPIRQFEPHYECGFLSDDGQGQKYYTLQYAQLKWTGNVKEGYQLEDVLLGVNRSFNITFKGHPLSAQTTLKEFIQLSGVHTIRTSTGGENPEDLLQFTHNPKLKTQSVEVSFNGADDKYIFYFASGKLCKIEYWSPC